MPIKWPCLCNKADEPLDDMVFGERYSIKSYSIKSYYNKNVFDEKVCIMVFYEKLFYETTI